MKPAKEPEILAPTQQSGWRNAVVLAVAVLGAMVVPHSAAAMTADELFTDGNRLFRDELYWAALLRYEQAGAAGLDSPLLHYNTGVAHYKAGQYDRARESLKMASRHGRLRVISMYNLGLVAYAQGDLEAAVDYFRAARDQDESQKISDLARRAIGRVNRELLTQDPLEIPESRREPDRPLTNLELRARVGAGMDSNVYRSPPVAYIDESDPNRPLVTPNVQEGMFVPVTLHSKYQVNSLENEGFFGLYRMAGRFYQDQNLENGNEYLHELGFGSEYRRREENRDRRVYSAFKVAQHDETWYDPDTGLSYNVNGTDVGDRLSYLRYGPEFWARQTWGRFAIGGLAKGQLWNYEETSAVPEYDHEYWRVGLHAQYRFTRTSLIKVTGEYYTRRFGDRPSFDLDGRQIIGAPPVRYDYTDLGVEARQRITDWMWFGVGYARTSRVDQYVGYNNYQRDSYGAQFHMAVGDRFDLDVTGGYRIYHFENAYAFHEPTAGRRTQESASGEIVASYRMTDSLTLVGEYLYREVASNDTRIAYDRSQMLVSVRWNYY